MAETNCEWKYRFKILFSIQSVYISFIEHIGKLNLDTSTGHYVHTFRQL